MFLKKIWWLVVFSLGISPVMGQEKVNAITVTFSPQHLMVDGLHLTFEKPNARHSRRSLLFSPHFYLGKTRTLDYLSWHHDDYPENAAVKGLGLDVQQRWYFSENTNIRKERTYLAYGLNLHHFAVGYKKEAWAETTEADGLTYYHLRMQPVQTKINRLGAVVLFGAQNPFIGSRTVWDIFVGLGYNHSFRTAEVSRFRYNRNFLDYGYTGLYFLAGLKVGVVL